MTVPEPIRRAAHAVLATAAVLLPAACGGDNQPAGGSPNLFTVERADLPITVKENAEMQALRETIVRSGVEGQSTIISIVPEGTMVQKGDLLFELDVSELVEKRATQAIAVTRAEAAWHQSQEDHRILGKEQQTKYGTASSNRTIMKLQLEKFLGQRSGRHVGVDGTNAEMIKKLLELVSTAPDAAATADAADRRTVGTTAVAADQPSDAIVTSIDPRKFARLVDKAQDLLQLRAPAPPVDDGTTPANAVPANAVPANTGPATFALDHDMGEMANRVLQQIDQIRLAMADLKVKEDTYGYSKRLADKVFITRNELEKDKLAWQSQVSKVTLAWNDLDLLINYTLAQEIIKLRQDVDNAELELERVVASNNAAELKAQSDEDSKKAEYELARERLVNLDRQIESAVIKAPWPGVVVYAKIDRGRGGEAVREGVQVRERQDIIVLPDTTRMRAVIKVQEAQVDKLAVGQQAIVQAEAHSEVFMGHVTNVAPVADSNSGWMTSDRKVYTTVVELDDDNSDGRLRSRMAAAVTIMVGTIKDVLPVPSQAVRRDRSVHYVWKQTDQGPVATKVELGQHNAERVAIASGVQAGDVIWLVPPTGVQEPKFEQPVLPVAAPALPNEPGSSPGNGGTGNGTGDAAKGDRTGGARGDGQRGNGNGGSRRPGGMQRKKIAEMTPDELAAYPGQLDSMRSMTEQFGGEQAQPILELIDKLKQALAAKKLDEAQTLQDSLRALQRQAMGNRGRRGGDGNPAGEDGGGPPRDRGGRRPN